MGKIGNNNSFKMGRPYQAPNIPSSSIRTTMKQHDRVPRIDGRDIYFVRRAFHTEQIFNPIKVQMGEYAVIKKGTADLVSGGASSCVLLILMDKESGIFALSHIDAKANIEKSIDIMVKSMIAMEAKKENIIVVAGAGDTLRFAFLPLKIVDALKKSQIKLIKTMWDLGIGEVVARGYGDVIFGGFCEFKIFDKPHEYPSSSYKKGYLPRQEILESGYRRAAIR